MSDENEKRPKWMPSPFDTSNPNKDRYKRSKKQEQRIAADLGGRRLPNSGGKARSKWAKVGKVSNVSLDGKYEKAGFETITLDGDIGHAKFHIEHKRTEKESIAIKKDWWLKVSRGAKGTKTIPALVLTFEEAGRPPIDIAVVPYELLRSLAKR